MRAMQPGCERIGLGLAGLRCVAASAFADCCAFDLRMRCRKRQPGFVAAPADVGGTFGVLSRRRHGEYTHQQEADSEHGSDRSKHPWSHRHLLQDELNGASDIRWAYDPAWEVYPKYK